MLPNLLHLLPENPVKVQGSWSLNWLPLRVQRDQKLPPKRGRGLARLPLRAEKERVKPAIHKLRGTSARPSAPTAGMGL